MSKTITGPTLALGIDARGAKTGAQQFREAMTDVANVTDKAERSYRSSGGALLQMAGGLPTTSSRIREMTSSVGGLSSKLVDATAKTRQLSQANVELSRTSALLKNIGAGLVQGAGMSIFTQLSQLPRQFIEVSATAERMSRSLTVATGSSGEAATVLGRLYEISSRLGAPMEGLAQLYAGVARSASELGVSQQQILQVTEGVSAAISLSGTSAGSASGAMLQMAQAMASGTVRAEEFNSMIEGIPALMGAAARHIDGTNGSIAQMRQKVIDGKLSSQEFFKAVEAGSADLSKQAADMDQSWDAAMQSMYNGGTRFIANMNDATGVTAGLKMALSSLGAVADSVSVSLEAAMGKIDSQIKVQKDRIATLKQMAEHPGLGPVAKDMLPDAESKLERLTKEMDFRKSVGEALKAPKAAKTDEKVVQSDKDKLLVSKEQLRLTQQQASVEDNRAKRLQLNLDVAKQSLALKLQEINQESKGETAAARRTIAEKEYQADVRGAKQDFDRDATRDGKRAATGARTAASKAARVEKQDARDAESFESFRDNIAASYWRNTGDQIQAAEEERRKLLDRLSEIRGASTADRDAVAKQINEGADAKIAELKTRQLEAVEEVTSNSEILLLASEGRIAESTEKRIEIQMKLIKLRGEAELKQLEQLADKLQLDAETKSELLDRKQREINNESTAAKDEILRRDLDKTTDSVGMMESAFKSMGNSAGSAFEDAIKGGEKFSDILSGLASDLQSIAIKKFISEPLGKMLDQSMGTGKGGKKDETTPDLVGGIESFFSNYPKQTTKLGRGASDLWSKLFGSGEKEFEGVDAGGDLQEQFKTSLDKQMEAGTKLMESGDSLKLSGDVLSNAGSFLASAAGSLLSEALGGGKAGQAAGGIAGVAMQVGMAAMMAAKDGAVLSHGYRQAFASGGVVSQPTTFPMANGTGLMGEAGPEAILPLARGADGSLGVKGGSGGKPSVTVNNYSVSPVRVEEDPEDPNGILVMVDHVEREIAKRNARSGTLMNRSTKHAISPLKAR